MCIRDSAKSDPRLDPRVAMAIARLEARLDNPETSAEMAAALGLSQRRLEQIFAENLGLTPAAYVLGQRLAAARRMITDTRHPLAEVAPVSYTHLDVYKRQAYGP